MHIAERPLPTGTHENGQSHRYMSSAGQCPHTNKESIRQKILHPSVKLIDINVEDRMRD